MERKTLVEKVYQSGDLLSVDNLDYKKRIENYLENKFKNDVGLGDVTTDSVVKPDIYAKALIKSKEKGIISGIEEVVGFYENHGLEVISYVEDGDGVDRYDGVLSLEGYAKDLLETERTGLNFLQMMGGIATNTKKYSDEIKEYDAMVAATRKEWSDEWFEKKAVVIGGGLTHRIGLYGFVLIKDNHLKVLEIEGVGNPIDSAIERAYASGSYAIEIEVENMEEALCAGEKFMEYGGLYGEATPIIMLDNMRPEEERKIIPLIKDAALVEASGNIDLYNIREHAEAGVDVISTSRLNRGASALDLSQKIV